MLISGEFVRVPNHPGALKGAKQAPTKKRNESHSKHPESFLQHQVADTSLTFQLSHC